MSKINTFFKIINDKEKMNKAIANNIGRSKLSRLIPSKLYLKMMYKLIIGQKLNLRDPKTFNEKLQWLKIYDRCPDYVKMVDKFNVKRYVSNIIGEEYVIPTLGVWDHFDQINFKTLPNSFVLKCTHDSGSTFVCKDRESFDFVKARKSLKKKIKTNLYWWSREWPYKHLRPRIIAEELLQDDMYEDIQDYKFMCFNGKVECSFVCSDRFSDKGLHVTFFDRDWNKMPFERKYPSKSESIAKPKNYNLMIELAEKLSQNIPFVRVDFYEVNGKVYFGELTFYPGAGLEEFRPKEWDLRLGEYIVLKK